MKIIYLALVEIEVYNAPRTHTIEVCENLTNLGHDVLLIIPRPWKEKQTFSFPVIYIPFWGWGVFREWLYNIVLSFHLIYYILTFRPDVAYERMMSNPLCLFITKIFRIKHVLEVNGPPFKQGKPFQNTLIKLEIKNTTGIVVPSQNLKKLLLKETTCSESMITFIPNGVNPKIFFPQDKRKARQMLGLEENYFYIGYTGGIYFAYDFDFVFTSMEKIKKEIQDMQLLIIGPHTKEKYPENVVFIKNIEYDKVPLYLHALDMCILPLSEQGIKTQNFISRVKIFEYIACGKIVLVPKLHDEEIPEIFKKFLIFYKYGDEEDFLKIIKEIYNKKSLNIRSEDVEVFAKEYSWEVTAKKTEELLLSKKIGVVRRT